MAESDTAKPKRAAHSQAGAPRADRDQPQDPSQGEPQGEPEDQPKEIGGRAGPEPTRYGDWEVGGLCTDF